MHATHDGWYISQGIFVSVAGAVIGGFWGGTLRRFNTAVLIGCLSSIPTSYATELLHTFCRYILCEKIVRDEEQEI